MRWLRRTRDDESGATLVVVAITLLGLFGISMLAVDGGSLFTTKRSLVTDTDASALAAARYLSNAPTDCVLASDPLSKESSATYAEALTVLEENDTRTGEPFEFEVDPIAAGDCTAGKVRVADTIESPVFFSGLFGFSGFDVYSSSSAIFGHFREMKGLRPFGICDKDEHFAEWLGAVAANPDHPEDELPASTSPGELLGHPNGTYPGAAYWVHRIEFRDPTLGGSCGTDKDAGNWGWMDFDGGGSESAPNSCKKGGGSGGADDLKCRIDIGYEGYVGTDDCDHTESGDNPCPAEAGAKNTVKTNLKGITCSTGATADLIRDKADCVIWILVYDDVTVKTSGGGKTLQYHPMAFLQVILRGWSDGVLVGNPKAEDYFDFEFIGYDPVGPIDGKLGRDTTGLGLLPKGTQLCGGNYGGTIDENCGLSG